MNELGISTGETAMIIGLNGHATAYVWPDRSESSGSFIMDRYYIRICPMLRYSLGVRIGDTVEVMPLPQVPPPRADTLVISILRYSQGGKASISGSTKTSLLDEIVAGIKTSLINVPVVEGQRLKMRLDSPLPEVEIKIMKVEPKLAPVNVAIVDEDTYLDVQVDDDGGDSRIAPKGGDDVAVSPFISRVVVVGDELQEFLEVYADARINGADCVALLIGPTAIGKTTSVHEFARRFARKRGLKFLDLTMLEVKERLVSMCEEDVETLRRVLSDSVVFLSIDLASVGDMSLFLGVPQIKLREFSYFLPPYFIKFASMASYSIILFDDFQNPPEPVQRQLFEFIRSGQLGDFRIDPRRLIPIIIMNPPEEDPSGSFPRIPALHSRFLKIHVTKAPLEQFVDYLRRETGNELIAQFLLKHRELYEKSSAKVIEKDYGESFPTPRSIVNLARILEHMGVDLDNVSAIARAKRDNMLRKKIFVFASGLCGSTFAEKLLQFIYDLAIFNVIEFIRNPDEYLEKNKEILEDRSNLIVATRTLAEYVADSIKNDKDYSNALIASHKFLEFASKIDKGICYLFMSLLEQQGADILFKYYALSRRLSSSTEVKAILDEVFSLYSKTLESLQEGITYG